VAIADENGKASAEQQRDGEAEVVAEMCARLIGSEMILDRRSGASRICRPGDIALLAPTGSDLWRYEEASSGMAFLLPPKLAKACFADKRFRISSRLRACSPTGATPWPSARFCAARWSPDRRRAARHHLGTAAIGR